MHIEQGPVLLDLDMPLRVVLGTFGVEKEHAITFHGQAAHSGSTPMNRKDAFTAAAQMSRNLPHRRAQTNGGVCTMRLLHHGARHRHKRG